MPMYYFFIDSLCFLFGNRKFFDCLFSHEVFFYCFIYHENLPAIIVIEKDVMHVFCNTSKATVIFD